MRAMSTFRCASQLRMSLAMWAVSTAPRVVVGQEKQLPFASAQQHGMGVAVLVPDGGLG